MIVDDTPENLTLLREILSEHDFEVSALPSGSLALQAANKVPPNLLLLDINMPEMNGYEVCRRFKESEKLQEIPIIFLSALSTTEDKIKAFHLGGVDYITKPFNSEEVLSRVETHLKLRALQEKLEFQNDNLRHIVEEKVREISEAQLGTIFALAKLAENRDEDTGDHLERVRDYCHIISTRLSESSPYAKTISREFTDCIKQASPLHDIGKVAMPDSILLKPGKLTEEEFEVMKTHTTIGAENLKVVHERYPGNAFIKMGIEIALYHHEKWNGEGYPRGLKREEIPLSARIMALADFYDALRSDRCYRRGLDHLVVKEMVEAGKGSHFDPHVVDAFLAEESCFEKADYSLSPVS